MRKCQAMDQPRNAITVPIRALRLAHNLTLEDLQLRIDDQGVSVTPSALSNAERGKKRVSERLLCAWARALGVHPLDIVQGEATNAGSACSGNEASAVSTPATAVAP